jgi:hypothetical protein
MVFTKKMIIVKGGKKGHEMGVRRGEGKYPSPLRIALMESFQLITL